MEEVKLHGVWVSPFSARVIWTLKLKGIPYEHIEEDLLNNNKSPQLLQYNPVYKKIPVLVHAGKPICESMIIVQYIDEIWPQNPLLPSDPLDRALAGFWVKYAEDKGSAALWALFLSSGEKLENAIKDSLELLRVVEEQCLGDGKKFFGGDTLNIVDIAFGAIVHWLRILEDAIEVKIFEEDKFPRLHAWITNFRHVPAISENLPDHDKIVANFKSRREQFLASS